MGLSVLKSVLDVFDNSVPVVVVVSAAVAALAAVASFFDSCYSLVEPAFDSRHCRL